MHDKMRKTTPISRQKKHIRILLILFGVILVLGGGVFYHLSLASRRLEKHIEALLQKYELGPFNMDKVQADGLTGVRINSFTLDGDETSETPHGIHLEGLRLSGDWPAVFGGKMEVRSVFAKKARIVLSRDETGRWVTGRGISSAMLADTAPVRMRVGKLVLVFAETISGEGDEVAVEFGPMELNTMRLSRRETRMAGALDHASLGSWHFDIIVPDESNSLSGEITGRRIFLGRTTPVFLPPPISSYWEAANISRGSADMWLGFEFNTLTGALSGIHANIRFSDCALNPKGAPYPLSGVTGQMRYDGRRLEFSGSGRVGGGEFQAGGYAIPESEGTYLDATVSLSGCVLTDNVETAWLGEKAGRLWKRIRPSGEIDGQIRLAGNTGASRPPEVQASIRLKEGRVWPSELPQPISNLSAVVTIDENVFLLKEGAGAYEGAEASVRNQRFPIKSGIPFSFTVNVRNLSIGDELKDAISSDWVEKLPYGFGRLWDGLRLTGKVDMDFSFVRRADADGAIIPFVNMTFNDAVLAHPQLPMRLTHITGKLEGEPGRISTENIRARSGEIRLEIDEAALNVGRRRSGFVKGRVTGITYDSDLKKLIPGGLVGLADRNRFQGSADVQFDIQSDGDDVRADMKADIDDGNITLSSFPYPLAIKSGSFILTNGQPARFEISGTHDESDIRIEWAEKTPDESSYIRFAANRIRLDERLKNALPEWGKDIWTKVAPTGRMNVNMHAVKEGREETGLYTATGDIQLKNAAFRPEVALADIAGMMQFRAALPFSRENDGKLNELTLEFDFDSISIDRKEFDNLVGGLSFNSRKTDFVIKRGKVFGGEISGEWSIDKTEKTTSVAMEAKNVDAAAANRNRGLGFREIAGRLNSRISLASRADFSGATGRGWISIENGRVGELPGGIQLTEYFQHARDEATQLTDVRYEYRMRDGKIEITAMSFSTTEAILKGACRPEDEPFKGRIIVNFTPEFMPGVEHRVAVREVIQALIRDRNIRVAFPENWDAPLWRIDPSFGLIESVFKSLRLLEGDN